MTDPQDLINQATTICEAATPGPWVFDFAADGIFEKDYREGDDGGVVAALDLYSKPDGQFIAAARTLVPALASALNAATQERDEALAELKLATELAVNTHDRPSGDHVPCRPDVFDRGLIKDVRQTLLGGGGEVTFDGGGLGEVTRDASVMADFMLKTYADAHAVMSEVVGWAKQAERSARSILELRDRELAEARADKQRAYAELGWAMQ